MAEVVAVRHLPPIQKAILSSHAQYFGLHEDPANPYHVKDLMPGILASSPIKPAWFMSLKVTAHLLCHGFRTGIKSDVEGEREATMHIFNDLTRNEHGAKSDIAHLLTITNEEMVQIIEKHKSRSIESRKIEELAQLLMLINWKLNAQMVTQVLDIRLLGDDMKQSRCEPDLIDIIIPFRQDLYNIAGRLMLSAFAPMTFMIMGLYKFCIQYTSGLAYGFKVGSGDFPWIESFVYNFRMVVSTLWLLGGVKPTLEFADFDYPVPSRFDPDTVAMSRSLGKKLENADHCEICGKKFPVKIVVYPVEYGLCRVPYLFPREFLWISRPRSSWGSPPDIFNSKRSVIIVCGRSCLMDAGKTFSPALAKFCDTLDDACSTDNDSKNWSAKPLFQHMLNIHSQEMKDFVISTADIWLDLDTNYFMTHRQLRGFSNVWLLDNVDLINPKIIYKSKKECLYLIDTIRYSFSESEIQMITKEHLTKTTEPLIVSLKSGAISPDSPIGQCRARVLKDIQQTPTGKMETVAEIALYWSKQPELAPEFKFAHEKLSIPATVQICPTFKTPFFMGGSDFYTQAVKYCFRSSSTVVFPAPNKCFQYSVYKVGWKFELKPKTSRGLEDLQRIFMDNDCLILTSGMDLINKTADGAFLYKDGIHFIGFIIPDMFKFLMGSSTFQEVCSSYLKVHFSIEGIKELQSATTKFEKSAKRRPCKDAEIENVLKAVRIAAIYHTFLHRLSEAKRLDFIGDIEDCASVFFHICLKTDKHEDRNVIVRLGTLNQSPGDAVVGEFREMIDSFDTVMKVRYLPLPGKPNPPRFNPNERLCYPTGPDKLEFHLKVDIPEMWKDFGYIDNVEVFDGHFDVVRATFEIKEEFDRETSKYFFLITKDKPIRQWVRHLLDVSGIEEFVPRSVFINLLEDQSEADNILVEPLVVDESKSIFEIEESHGTDLSHGHFVVVLQNTFNFLDKIFDRKWFAPEPKFALSHNRVVWYGTVGTGNMFSWQSIDTQLWLIGDQSISILDEVTISKQIFFLMPITDELSESMTEVASYRAIISPVWSSKRFVDLTQDVILRIARSNGKLGVWFNVGTQDEYLILSLRYDAKLKSLFATVLRDIDKGEQSAINGSLAQAQTKMFLPCLFTPVKGIFLSEPVFMLIRETQPQEEEFAKYTDVLKSKTSSILDVMIPLDEFLAEKAKAICIPSELKTPVLKRVRIDLKPMHVPLHLPYMIIGMNPNVEDSKENPILRDDLYLAEIIAQDQLSLILIPIETRRQLSQFCLHEKLTFVPKSALKPAPVVENERILWITNRYIPVVISYEGVWPSTDDYAVRDIISWMMSPHQSLMIAKPTAVLPTRVTDPDDLVQFDVRFLNKIEPFSQVDMFLTCLLTMKELTIYVDNVSLSLRYYREERVPLKLEISIERTLKHAQECLSKKLSSSFTGSKLVGNISVGYQERAVWEFLIVSSKSSMSVDCFMNEEVSPNSEDPTHELITSWTNPKVLRRMAKESKSKMVPIELHLIRQAQDPMLTYLTNELEFVAQEAKSFPLLVIPRRSDFLTQSSTYSGSNPKLGGFLLEFERHGNIFTGKFFPRQVIIEMIIRGGAEIYHENTANNHKTDGHCSEDLDLRNTNLEEVLQFTEKIMQEREEKRQAEEAKIQLIQSVNDLIQECASRGPKLSIKKNLTKSQVARIAPNIDVEKALEYVGGLQSLSYHVKVRRDELQDNDLNKTINLPSLRVDNRNEKKFQELLDQMVEKACTTLSKSPTFELSRCAFCRREDFEFPVCQTCRVTKYCNERCFNKDKFTHMKECVDRSKSLALETLSDTKKVFPQM